MKIKKILGVLLLSALSLSVLLTGCGAATSSSSSSSSTSSTGKKKVIAGFIYNSTVGDGGWTYAHNEGRKKLESELGIKTIFKENVKEDPAETEKVCEDMINQGANVIFGCSFGYGDGIAVEAKKHPEVTFLHCSGVKTSKNIGTYFAEIEQPRYLSGIVAGMKTKSKKIGYVAAFSEPECIRGINAFALGVQSVCPDAKVMVTWTNTWYDPAKEKAAAVALLDQGCDVMAQHQDSAGPAQAAEEKGAFAIGYDSDMSSKAPKSYMTAPVWDWSIYYIKTVKAVQDGTWKAEAYYPGMESGVAKLAPLTANAPEGAQAKIDAVTAEIKSGKDKLFTGPIKDQSGTVKVADGKKMTLNEIVSWDWFVQGVVGKVQK